MLRFGDDAARTSIKGNHEDFAWLDEQLRAGRREILPGLTYLPSGDVIDIGEDRERIRIGGIGGCHGPSNYGLIAHVRDGVAFHAGRRGKPETLGWGRDKNERDYSM